MLDDLAIRVLHLIFFVHRNSCCSVENVVHFTSTMCYFSVKMGFLLIRNLNSGLNSGQFNTKFGKIRPGLRCNRKGGGFYVPTRFWD